MTTRTTLRLGGLAAAIVVSLAIVSSAAARPVGIYTQSVNVASQPGHGSGVVLHRSGLWVHKGGSPNLTAVPPKGPADRHGGIYIPAVPVTPVATVESSSFDWTDAAIGALFGVALAFLAVYAAMTLRGRRDRIALGA